MVRLFRPAARRLLPAMLVLYGVLAVLYAVYTPAWQAPDEPAHYNYVRYLAEQHRFPILKPGDYPAAYLEEIKAAHFTPELSIAPLRYEFHQPPLYYLLAVPVYRLSGGALLPLRLLSAGLGALIVWLVYRAVRELLDEPERPESGRWPALGAAAFAAFLPMHLAGTAAAGNDPLAELLLAAILLLAIRYLKAPDGAAEGRALVVLGVASGVALVTKSGAYVALPLVLAAIAARQLWLCRAPGAAGRASKAAGLYLLPAIGLAAPWWARNAVLYGGLDILGLGRHGQVVAGQLRTAEYLAAHGPARWAAEFAAGTLRSFWGQFGWMGVLLDARLYQALAVLTALGAAGFVAWAVRCARPGAAIRDPRRSARLAAAGLLGLAALLTAASYVWYNTQFVQFQGRYLFPALLPIALGMAVGWREALRREMAWPLAGLLAAGAAVLAGVGLARGDLPGWPLAILLAAAGALAARRFLPRAWDPLVQAVPYLVLVPLDLACLFLFIVPQLA